MQKFVTNSELPRLSDKGFDVIDLPQNIFMYLQELYVLLLPHTKPELGLEDVIQSNKVDVASEIMSLDKVPTLKQLIHDMIQPIMEEWIGYQEEIEPIFFYGIRSYKNGAVLKSHKDSVATHHVSGIIIVDYQGKNWPLDIQDHDGKWHKVYAEPGQMILYESAICEHGRVDPFHGEFFRNCYIHYKLKNYEYLA